MKKYAIISNKKRNELVIRVAINGESVSRVAKQLRMKLPSAKSILRTYKKTGRIFDKKRIINRGIRTKKTDQSETEHLHSQEEPSNEKSKPEIKVEPSENGQERVKFEADAPKIEEIYAPKSLNFHRTFEQILQYRNYLEICLRHQLNNFNRMMSCYRIQNI